MIITFCFFFFFGYNTQVTESKEFRRSYFRESSFTADFKSGSFSVWCYRGNDANPKWKDVDTSEDSQSFFFFSVSLMIKCLSVCLFFFCR